jgi:imidazolonepropionase-like amidohydrolase
MLKKLVMTKAGVCVLVLSLIAFCFLFPGCSSTKPLPVAAVVVIDQINLIDVQNQQIVRLQQVELKNGKISAIRPAGTAIEDADAVVIDGLNGYLTPGLFDMHVHLSDPAALQLSLSHGVTHLRVMHGLPQLLKWRDAIEKNEMLGSSMTVSSPILSANKRPTTISVTDATEAKAAVRAAFAEGYDLIKAYGDLSDESLSALLKEAADLQMPVAKHGPHPSGAMLWQDLAAMQSLEHVEDIYQGPLHYEQDLPALQAVIEQLKLLQVPVTPTLNIFWQLTAISRDKEAFLATLPQDYISPLIAFEQRHNQVARWLQSTDKMAIHNAKTLQFLVQVTHQLHEKGVPLLVGSDAGALLSPHGLATHTEMQLLQQAGLDSFAVLHAATIEPAKALGLAKQAGQIRPGYKADFIYSKENPIIELSVLREPDAVMKSGRWYNKKQLTEMRQQAIKGRSLGQELWLILNNY